MIFFKGITPHTVGIFLDLGGQALALPPEFLERRPGLAPYQEKDLIVGLRPEHFTGAAPAPAPDQAVITIRVEVVETLGPVNYIHFSLPDLAGQGRLPWVASQAPAIAAAPEQELQLAVDPYRIHAFDPETGTAL